MSGENGLSGVNGVNGGGEPPALALVDFYRNLSATAQFNQWAGFEVADMAEGVCELVMAWRPDMGQYNGFLHAGLIAALLDTACGFAAHTMAAGGVLSSHFSVDCLAPAVGREFRALGRVVKAGRRQIFTSGELYAFAGEEPKLVATANAILVPLDAPSPTPA